MQRGLTLLILLVTILITASGKISIFSSKANSDDTIPNEAIRLRIIANSNSEIDQNVKLEIRDEVVNYIYPLVKEIEDQQEAREIIYQSVNEIEKLVNQVLIKNDIQTNYYVDYGMTNFPTKAYGDKIYKAGQYEAVYIVLGEGNGENWWCVLFPPLCLVDVTLEGGQVSENNEKVEYSLYLVEKINQFFKNIK